VLGALRLPVRLEGLDESVEVSNPCDGVGHDLSSACADPASVGTGARLSRRSLAREARVRAWERVLATFAQFEHRLIGQRTREAMAAKKASGTVFGPAPGSGGG
jgi:hypothetical protein